MINIDFEKMCLGKREIYPLYCFSNCLAILLRYKGALNSDLYINATLGVKGCTKSGAFYIGEKDDSKSVLPSLDGIYKKVICLGRDSREVLEENIDYIEKHNCPLLVDVDTFYLPYATNYNVNHALHTLLLLGRKGANEVQVLDWYSPWFFYGSIEEEIYMNARKSQNPYDGTIYSGMDVDNNYRVLNDDIPHRSSESLLLEMLKCSEAYCKCSSDDEYLGARAYVNFRSFLKDSYNTEHSVDYSNQMYKILSRYKLWTEYLIKAQTMVSVDNSVLIMKSQELAEQIDVLRYLLIKMKFRKSDINKSKILQRLDEIIQKQYELEELITEKIKQLSR